MLRRSVDNNIIHMILYFYYTISVYCHEGVRKSEEINELYGIIITVFDKSKTAKGVTDEKDNQCDINHNVPLEWERIFCAWIREYLRLWNKRR